MGPVQPRSTQPPAPPPPPTPSPRRPHVVFSEERSKRLRVMSDHRTQPQKASKSGVIIQPSFKKLRKVEWFRNPASKGFEKWSDHPTQLQEGFETHGDCTNASLKGFENWR